MSELKSLYATIQDRKENPDKVVILHTCLIKD